MGCVYIKIVIGNDDEWLEELRRTLHDQTRYAEGKYLDR